MYTVLSGAPAMSMAIPAMTAIFVSSYVQVLMTKQEVDLLQGVLTALVKKG